MNAVKAIEKIMLHGIDEFFAMAVPEDDIEPCFFFAAGNRVRIWPLDGTRMTDYDYKHDVMEIVRFIANDSKSVQAVGVVMHAWKKDETNTLRLGELIITAISSREHMEQQGIFELTRDNAERPIKTSEEIIYHDPNAEILLSDKGGTIGDFFGGAPKKEQLNQELLRNALESLLARKVEFDNIPDRKEQTRGNQETLH